MISRKLRTGMTIRLTPQMHAAVQEMAKSQNKSVNAYIRSLIEYDLQYSAEPREYKIAANMYFLK